MDSEHLPEFRDSCKVSYQDLHRMGIASLVEAIDSIRLEAQTSGSSSLLLQFLEVLRPALVLYDVARPRLHPLSRENIK